MATQWVVTIVELTVPTEKVIGPFATSQAAGAYIEDARNSGQWEREKWQRVGSLELFAPEQG